MTVLQQIDDRLAALEARLADRPADAGEVRALRRLLADPDGLWIEAAEARQLLDVETVATVEALARLGSLRRRQGADDRLEVRLDDVLRERDRHRTLLGDADERELPREELHRVRRQLGDPAERARVDAELAAAGIRLEPAGEAAGRPA